MVRTRVAVTSAVAVISVLLAGCSTEEPGSAAPAETQDTASPSTSAPGGTDDLPAGGAPAVEEPLDTSKFEQDPCAALTVEQLNELNLPEQGEERDGGAGPTCGWNNRETTGSATIILVTASDRGLTALYETRGDYEVFEPVDLIEGHPGVVYSSAEKANWHCTVAVGLTDELAMDVNVRLSRANRGGDGCGTVQGIAGYMLQTMKAAQ
ncbi:uncharacterized protein DUF3558 [Tamaricihabitans halophyticus]|uniref:Uncharacterized protein DUF3558 n=1 Tax=Tamaricihabitans halophyticus TaxID=1262583 RepID=A0A4R2R1F7_9PSEU|nr:DUF3558 domain-containing protein [Tamaricihabitans halophyticus]TCP56520.1 uncharacterized protein DUF3558 [Tamaricihabitans halophyticus]